MLCGYFSKLMAHLSNYNRKEFNEQVFHTESLVIKNLINHIYNRSLTDLLIKIINTSTVDEEDATPNILNDASSKYEIVDLLIDKLSQGFEDGLNSVFVLKELISNKKFKNIFLEEKVNEKLFTQMKSRNEKTTRATLEVLIALWNEYPFGEEEDADEPLKNPISKTMVSLI